MGVAGKITAKEEKVFKSLLIVDQLRGTHSTGVANVTMFNKTSIAKLAVTPSDLFQYKPFMDIMKESNNVLIGHNRYATRGAKNAINAHPFECGDIIGTHNGTLYRQNLLPDSSKFEVDSENIFHSINTIGSEETHKKLFGAFALVWWDKKENKLHFSRNDERTFFYTKSLDEKTMFWASEYWMLECVLDREGVEYGDIYYTVPLTEYVFEIPRQANTAAYPKIAYPEERKREEYVVPKAPAVKKPLGVSRLPKTNNKDEYSSGSEVTFYLGSTPHKDRNTFKGFVKGNHAIEVEVNCPSTLPIYTDLCIGYGSFQGTVSSFYRKNDVIWKLVVNGKSVIRDTYAIGDPVEEEEEKDDAVEETLAFNSSEGEVFLSQSEFEEKQTHGCAWCSDVVPFTKGAFITDDDDVVCEGCSQNPEVQIYLGCNVPETKH